MVHHLIQIHLKQAHAHDLVQSLEVQECIKHMVHCHFQVHLVHVCSCTSTVLHLKTISSSIRLAILEQDSGVALMSPMPTCIPLTSRKGWFSRFRICCTTAQQSLASAAVSLGQLCHAAEMTASHPLFLSCCGELCMH